MTDALTCPRCHTELPANAPAGMCPRCLMEAALAESSDENQAQVDSPYAETTPQPRSFQPPESGVLANQFPHLEILELLGQGGMGAVYKARQPKLDRLVALKIIRPESADDPAFAERFNREARTLARLSHPNIVAVHDFGEETLSQTDADDSPRTLYYFLMEYVDGANLRQLMDRGELSLEQTLQIVPQICDALQFAHDEGVVHRDIKPENILVDSRGRVKIADFGLAKLASPSEHDFTLTGTHQVMGTPRYMAPEQMAGSRAVDHRADLYALGVVFYEMLTGQIPAGHFSPPSVHASIDVRLDDVVMKTLAQKPEDRFQSAREIRASLEAIAQQPGGAEFSQMSAPDLPPARGLSTVFERQVAAAWHWVADKAAPAEQTGSEKTSAQFPSLLMGLLCVIGLLMPLAPWMIIAVTDPDVTHGIPSEELTMFHGSASKLIEKSGFEHPAGVVSAILLAMLAVLCLSVPSWRRPNHFIAGLMVGLSGCAFLSVFFFPNQAPHIYLEFNPPAAETEPGVTVVTTPSIQPISHLDHKIYLQPAFYGSLAVSGILLLLSAVGLRHAEPLGKSGWSWQKVWAGELAANLMLVSTLVLSLLGGLTMLLPWAEVHIPQDAGLAQIDKTARLAAPVTQVFSGTGIWSSLAAGGMCLLVGFVLLLSPQRRSPGWMTTSLMTLFSVVAVIHTAAYSAELNARGLLKFNIEVSEQAARWFSNSGVSEEVVLDPESATRRVMIPQSVYVWTFRDYVTYREGYYAALGISLGLVLLSVIGVRNAVLNREPKSETQETWPGTPVASLRFTVPVKGDIGSKIRFHFLGLGYELEKEQPENWIFQRGTTMGGMMQTDIRSYPTRLSVNSIADDEGQYLVNCHWSVRLMGGWVGKSDIKILEDEGRELESLLGGRSTPPAGTAVSSTAVDSTAAAVTAVPPEVHRVDESENRPEPEKWIDTGKSYIDLSSILSEVTGPAVAMIIVGLVILVGHGITALRIAFGPRDPEFFFFMVPGVLTGLGMIVGGVHLRWLPSRGWAQMGTIAGFIPTGPGWLLSLPISLWAYNVLSRPQVKLAFLECDNRRRNVYKRRPTGAPAESEVDFAAVEDELSGPSITMMTLGLLIALGHLTLFLFSFMSPFDREMSVLALPGLLIGIGMLVGGLHMNQVWSRGWVQLGIIAGFIPGSFGWPFSLLLSIWALQVLSRPDVKAAFLQRKRGARGAAGVTSSVETLDYTALEDEVNGPSLAMIITGILISISHFVWSMLCFFNPYDQEVAAFAIPGLLVGIAMTVGGILLRTFDARGWVQLGIIAGMLPINAGWFLSLPICLWANSVFRRRDVRQAFLETAGGGKQLTSLPAGQAARIDLVAAEDRVSVPAIAMIVLGVLMPLAHFLLITMLIESRNGTAFMVMCLVPGILLGVPLLIGGLCLRKFGSRGWAQVGIIAGMLPVSPLWIFSIGISIRAQMLIGRAEIGQAFLERRRRDRTLKADPGGPEKPRISHVRPVPLVGLTVWSVIAIIGGMASFGWLRGELSETEISDYTAATLIPDSGAYQQVHVTAIGVERLQQRPDSSSAMSAHLNFQLTPLKYSEYRGGTGLLEIELPTLGWRAPSRDGTEMGSPTGLTPDAIKEWMGLSGVDLNAEGVDKEARALFAIAEYAHQQPVFELADRSLFDVRAYESGSVSTVVREYQKWEHVRYCFYVWLAGVVLIQTVTLLWANNPSESLGRIAGKILVPLAILLVLGSMWYLVLGTSRTTMQTRTTRPQMQQSESISPPPDGQTSTQQTPHLYQAAFDGDVGQVKRLLDAGAGVNDKDPNFGQTPLMFAAGQGHTSLAATLVLLGADINERDKQGQTALMFAVQNHHEPVRKAIEKLVEISRIKDDQERKEKLQSFPGVDKRLVAGLPLDLTDLEIDALAQDSNGESVLMKAVKSRNLAYLRDADYDYQIASLQDKQGQTALMRAIALNDPAFVKQIHDVGKRKLYLIEGSFFVGGFEPNPMFDPRALSPANVQGDTALRVAEKQGRRQTDETISSDQLIREDMQRLIEIATRDLESAELLPSLRKPWLELRGHAYLALGEKDKAETDFNAARQNQSPDANQPVSQTDELHSAAAQGQIGRIRQLLQGAGTDINDKDSEGKTPLMYAAENNQKSTVLALIVLGANIGETDPDGRNAVMLAAARGHADLLLAMDNLANFVAECRNDNATPEEAVERFQEFPGIDRDILQEVKPNALRFRVPVKVQDKQGMTAAMMAAANGDIKCLEVLWSLGDMGDDCRQDRQGRTVLMHGLLNGHDELVLKFLEGFVKTDPAELSPVDRQGQTLYSLAGQRGAQEVTDRMQKLLAAEVEKYTKIIAEDPQGDSVRPFREKLLKALETTKTSPADPAAQESSATE